MALIHSTAVVHHSAKLADSVEIGPFCVIGEFVEIGANTKVGPHCVIEGHTTIGESNVFHGSSHIGCAPQDKKFNDEPTKLIIGSGNSFYQFITVSIGTIQDQGVTSIGDDNWVMAYSHIAHDCQIGNHTILANNATLAGHVTLGDWVFLGGFTTIHQFCRIGAHAMTAFTAAVTQDVPPYVTAAGNRAQPAGINSEGLRRRGFSADQITAIKRAYKILYRQGLSLDDAKDQLTKLADTDAVLQPFVDFFAVSTRGLIR